MTVTDTSELDRLAPGLRAAGWSYAAIGRRFGVTGVTVKKHLDPLFRDRQLVSTRRWKQLHPQRDQLSHNLARDGL